MMLSPSSVYDFTRANVAQQQGKPPNLKKKNDVIRIRSLTAASQLYCCTRRFPSLAYAPRHSFLFLVSPLSEFCLTMFICPTALVLLLSNAVSSASAFAPSGTHSLNVCAGLCSSAKHHRVPSCLGMTQEEDSEVMRHEIEEMRKEALRRIEALNSQVSHATPTNKTMKSATQESSEDDNSATTSTAVRVESKREQDDETYRHRVAVSNAQPEKTPLSASAEDSSSRRTSAQLERDELSLLHGTCWKIMLNIGREEARSLLPENAPTSRSGTWMPKTWGISGERLLLSLEVEFTPKQLYEREEFLNGVGGAKELQVINQELTLGPSVTEGSRKIKVYNGGWRVCKGEGPLGTDILRFFFDVTEEVSHQGGDVYCPAGKVYCTCGYFPQYPRNPFSKSTREMLRERQEVLNRRYEQLSKEMQEDSSLVSWDKMVRGKELLQLRVEAGKLAERVNEARVREPDKSLLRLSKNLDVGLTREGGVCCKVPKGMITEYHILGKFGLGAVEKQQPQEELLP